ncbi:MAG: tail fiber domain-containing protein [Candidatus Margulisiibacteriota bacterium]
MKKLVAVFFILVLSIFSIAEEKIIEVPSQMTVEMILSNDQGLYNGNFNVRARIYDSVTRERIWFEDYDNYSISDGNLVLVMNSVPALNAYMLHRKKLKLVISVGAETAEIPLLTELYSYRSLFSEFGWETRFPHIFKIDRDKKYIGIGIEEPKTHVDVNGAIKLAYEETEVTGSIRWESDSLRIKHPKEWVDLLYGPLTFEASRWFDYGENIQLVSQNYRIGIGLDFPVHQFHVEGSAHFDGGLRATTLNATLFSINQFFLGNDLLKANSIHIKDNQRVMEWTPENLKILYGTLQGNGEDLTNVGQLEKDFAAKMISSIHLDGAVISSRNIYPNSVRLTHFAENQLEISRFVTGIFNADTISPNAIGSSNIMKNSLSFNILKDNNINDYIPDQFFNSDVVDNNSVYSENLQDYRVASINFTDRSIGTSHIKDQIILANHIPNNQVTSSKIKSGEITSELFSGQLSLANGGTGLSSLLSHRIITLGAGSFNSSTNIYLDDKSNLGIYDSPNLIQIERDFSYTLEVGSLDVSADVRIKDEGANPVKLSIENSSKSIDFELKGSGEFMFGDGANQLYLHSPMAISTSLGNSQHQFDLGSAITIGDSINSAPLAGTMEYDSTGFRFYNGTSWRVVRQSAFGIGMPVASGENQLQLNDVFLGQVASSSIQVSDSVIYRSDNSWIDGQDLTIQQAELARIQGSQLQVQDVKKSRIMANQSAFDFISDSEINAELGDYVQVENAHIRGGKHRLRFGNRLDLVGDDIYMNRVSDFKGRIDTAFIHNATSLDLNGNHVFIQDVKDSMIYGKSNSVDGATELRMFGQENQLASVQKLTLKGHRNSLISSQRGSVTGDENYTLGVNDIEINGNHQRVLGDYNRIKGNANLVIGDHVQVLGDQNVVLNASIQGIDVAANDSVVLNAPNGVHIHTGAGMVVSATPEGGGWSMVSDRNLKTQFMPVDHRMIFESLMALNISRWEYVFNRGVAHIGPMAQQFKGAFKIGEDERFITASDADGVAYSALKFLVQKTDGLQLDISQTTIPSLENFDRLLVQLNGQIAMLDDSLRLKKKALDTMVQNNLYQYQMIDKQLKVMGRYINQINYVGIWLGIFQIFGVIILGIAVGFYALRLYDKTRK